MSCTENEADGPLAEGAALEESSAAMKRRRFLRMLDNGDFDDLGDPEVIADAWR